MTAFVFMALAIDTGRLWLEKRGLQKAADIAALESSRFTGCGSTELDALQAAERAVSANKASWSTGTITMDFRRGLFSRDAKLLPVFTPIVGASDITKATYVKLSKTVPASVVAGGLFGDEVTIGAEALAEGGPPVATFSENSLGGISTDFANNLVKVFAGLLGKSQLNLTGEALKDISQGTVNLIALQAAAGVNSLEELMAKQATPQQWLKWISSASNLSDDAKKELDKIIQVSVNKEDVQFGLGKILNIQLPATDGVAKVGINVLDLVNATLIIGNLDSKSGLSQLFNIGFSLPALGVSTQMGFLSPPKIAVGSAGRSSSGAWCTQAESAQVAIVMAINPLKLGLVDMALRFTMGKTSANLANLSISAGNNTGKFNVASTAFELALTSTKSPKLPATVAAGLVSVHLNIPIFESTGGSTTFDVTSREALPVTTKSEYQLSSSISGALGDDTKIDVRVLGFGGDLFAGLVKPILKPILSIVGDGIIGPLLKGIGFDISLVKVTLKELQSPALELRQ